MIILRNYICCFWTRHQTNFSYTGVAVSISLILYVEKFIFFFYFFYRHRILSAFMNYSDLYIFFYKTYFGISVYFLQNLLLFYVMIIDTKFSAPSWIIQNLFWYIFTKFILYIYSNNIYWRATSAAGSGAPKKKPYLWCVSYLEIWNMYGEGRAAG